MRTIRWLVSVTVCGAVSGWAQDPTIQGLDSTGRLTFAEVAGASSYRVESAPRVDGVWTNSGSSLAPTGSGTVSVGVWPFALTTAFYRVVAVTGGAIPSDMGLIPAGPFSMGDAFGEGYTDELPVHPVQVSAFYMDKYEVTKAKWDEVYGWATAHGYGFDNTGSGKATNHPVQTVSWCDCVKWCNARSEKEGLVPCFTVAGSAYKTGQAAPDVNWSANGYRLPTEAEWEKAARGGVGGRRFPWADADTIQHARANYYSDSVYLYDTSSTRGYHPAFATDAYPFTSPAGSFAANGYGLYDMAGNVWEWCMDWYESALSGPPTDPRGPTSGSYRVLRGGGWHNYAFFLRCAYRGDGFPGYAWDSVGFRCARGL